MTKVRSRKSREIQERHAKRRAKVLASGRISAGTFREAVRRRKQRLAAEERVKQRQRRTR